MYLSTKGQRPAHLPRRTQSHLQTAPSNTFLPVAKDDTEKSTVTTRTARRLAAIPTGWGPSADCDLLPIGLLSVRVCTRLSATNYILTFVGLLGLLTLQQCCTVLLCGPRSGAKIATRIIESQLEASLEKRAGNPSLLTALGQNRCQQSAACRKWSLLLVKAPRERGAACPTARSYWPASVGEAVRPSGSKKFAEWPLANRSAAILEQLTRRYPLRTFKGQRARHQTT